MEKKVKEKVGIDIELMREMVNISNNSRLTTSVCTILSQLDRKDKEEIKTWLRHAGREISNKLAIGRRF